MFVDSATVLCQAGKGGDGCNSFERTKNVKHRRPSGGDGGRGGSIILGASGHVRTLLDLQMTKTFRAGDGKHGSGNHRAGAHGTDLVIHIPKGTEVFDEGTGLLLKDMCLENEQLEVCKGGSEGKGNHRKSEATPGEPGESKSIRLELKLIADVGLVGFPNAGKSTLISRVSNARAKIAAYPFTTKEPLLGVVKAGEDGSFVVADIPGLIRGAHEGRGLGHRFLKHIERTRLFLHLVDMAAFDGRDPVEDYGVINEELSKFSPVFSTRLQVVVANKMDIPEAADNLVKFREAIPVPVYPISAVTGKGVGELIFTLYDKLKSLAQEASE